MCEYAVSDNLVAALMAKERADEAAKEFDGVTADNSDDAVNWMQKLAIVPQTGAIKSTIDNVMIILDNDPGLKASSPE